MIPRSLLLLASLLTSLPAAALAQRDDTHRGMNFAIGLGRGAMSLKCDGCATSSQSDISLLARVGWTLRENLFVGVEGTGFQKAQIVNLETVEATFAFGGGVLLWYPRRYSEPFFKLGAGVSHSSGTFRVQSGGPAELKLNSPTLLIGVGTDLRMGRTFSITPFIDYFHAAGKDAELGGGSSVTLNSSTLNIGLAVTYH